MGNCTCLDFIMAKRWGSFVSEAQGISKFSDFFSNLKFPDQSQNSSTFL